jgi:lysophospholipase L1-like esterase
MKQTPRFNTKKWRNRFIYLCFLILITPLICEGVVRIYSWLFFPKMMRINTAYGWYHATDSQKYFTTEGEKALIVQNKLGHRGPNYGERTAKGKKRVLVLGDSFTEGSHVGEEDLFTNIIANKNPNLEVMNAGIGGWSTVQEYLYLRNAGIDLNPDLVLLMFFENDLIENCLSFYPSIGPRPYAYMQNGQLVINENPSPDEWRKYVLPLPFALQLNRYSLAYNFFNFRVYQTFRASYLNKMEYEDVRKTDSYPKMEIASLLYKQMHKMLNERTMLFAVGLIPTKQDAQKGSSVVIPTFLSFCQEQGISCISLLQPLKDEYDKGSKPYYNLDIHWNRTGHRVAAEVLGKYIQDKVSINP